MYIQKDWQIINEYDYSDIELDQTMVSELDLAGRILMSRGLIDPEQRKTFFAADLSMLHDPFLFKDMRKACEAIIRHGRAGSLIIVHGDYDADGLTSTALVIRALRRFGFLCDHVVPDRLIDGYGLSDSGINRIIDAGASLVITVDCGIASVDEVDRLNAAGIEVIITDHHEFRPELPRALALLNPKLPGHGYPFDALAGVGVALKLVQALDIMLDGGNKWINDISLAALGTVADVVPLIDENRIIVSQGIEQINKGAENVPAGICAMMDLCQKRNALNAGTMGFTLAPRLNAAGRLGDVEPALRLLLSDDASQTAKDAEILNELNKQRQSLEQKIIEEAVNRIEEMPDSGNRNVIVIAGRNWHPGVIGIVCSRLVEQYSRPVIMLAGDNGSNLRGSCRTYGDFDILAALEAAAEFTISYGGHKKAAGLELSADNLEAFADAVEIYARQHMDQLDLRPAILADMYLDESDLNIENARSLAALEPFGECNRQPLFISEGFRIIQWMLVGNGRHVKLVVEGKSGKHYDGIAFSMSDADELFTAGDRIDLLFSLEINEWQNRERLQLQIKDIHLSQSGDDFIDRPWLADGLYKNNWTLSKIAEKYSLGVDELMPAGSDFKAAYQFIRTRFASRCLETDLKILARRISSSYRIELNAFKLARIIEVFAESNLISLEWLGDDRCKFSLLEVNSKVRLEEASTYRRLLSEGEI